MKNQTQNELCDIETKVCKSQDILRVNDFMVCNEYMITKNAVTNSAISFQNIILIIWYRFVFTKLVRIENMQITPLIQRNVNYFLISFENKYQIISISNVNFSGS